MKKLLTAFAAILALAACGDDAPKNANEKPVIKIGAILPLVGDYNEAGEIAKQALMMFKRDLAGRGTKYAYEFVIEGNDGWDLKSSHKLSSKLVAVDKVRALITYWDASGQVVSLNIKNVPVVHVNMGSSLKTIENQNSFNMGPSSASEVGASLAEMNKRGIKTMAVLYSNDSWAGDIFAEYRKQAENRGISIVAGEQVNFGVKDFRGTLKKVAATAPGVVSLILEVPEFDIARKQMLELGIQTPITSIQMTELAENMANFESSWYVMYPDGSPAFHKDFAEFSKMRNNQNASIVYDIASLLVDAFENSDDPLEYLSAQESFAGMGGKYRQETPRFFQAQDLIKQVKDGELEIAE